MRVKKTRKSCSSFDNYLLLHDDYPLLMDHYLKLVDFYALIIDYLKKICVDSKYEHPSFSFRPTGQNRPVETRPHPIKNSTSERLHICHQRHVATGWQGCAMPDSVCVYAFLQIVARLRHAVLCQDQRLFHSCVRMRAGKPCPFYVANQISNGELL